MIETQRLKELYVKILDMNYERVTYWKKSEVLYFMDLLIQESEKDDEKYSRK